ncbi:unnamed protein product (macronuclear) [Paramecium tetraurelia]|uniref:Uncharacterized protein n=1 Tax=Paramecium tetraurelia TaxID=5888 RepID=A0DB45_PARTE|nr:uncharacterized protein GSPATT00015156001 [Paramecium tetraurelia]CAK80262.1 unnamed protein product [Paramecium tetraurelia]|eukprot:XP_001447659.1 hypothetical protein (macronuclear) [Paramecium tetraurelia strain d4-2]
MNYKPISDQQSVDIVEDDGELDVVNIKQNRRKNTSNSKLIIVWIIILIILFGGILIYVSDQAKEQKKVIPKEETKVNITIPKEQYNTKDESNLDGPKLIEIDEERKKDEGTDHKEDQELQNEQLHQEEDIPQQNVNKSELNQTIVSESQIKNQTVNGTEPHENKDTHKELQQNRRNDEVLCEKGYYMDKNLKACKQCEEKCSECMHITGTCYRCEEEYYLNIYGKCINICDQNQKKQPNLLISEENKNQTIPFCFGKNHSSSFYMGVQKSKSTHFVLPYLIIHPAKSVSQVYHNDFPIVYYFNKDLFNFEENIKLTDIAQEAQERLLIVIIVGSHTLYDYTLFNSFLFQNAIENIEQIVKAKSTTFRSYFGQEYNGYGVIREYISQYRNNTIDLIISDDPSELLHEEVELNQLVTQERHMTDYNFESLSGAKSDKSVLIVMEYTMKDENHHNNQCDRFKYVSFVHCQIREVQISHLQKMKQNFEFISQFVVQLNLE